VTSSSSHSSGRVSAGTIAHDADRCFRASNAKEDRGDGAPAVTIAPPPSAQSRDDLPSLVSVTSVRDAHR
jgi:hypothetical protein